ncbi:MAG: hypothetical protein WA160_15345 [Pseudobdellovibrio sp.]
MNENVKKRIFFIKSLPGDLTAIETYLAKRDYEVMSESDLRQGILKLIQFDPIYVFIAWDHPNEKVFTIPRIIRQSSAAIIIPYTIASGREFIRKLDFSGYAHRLYPPASGPSIMRLITKIEKEAVEELKDPEKKKTSSFTVAHSEMIHVKSANSKGMLDQFLKEFDEGLVKKEHSASISQLDLLQENQAKLKKFNLQKLDEKLKLQLQLKFNSDIKAQLLELAQSQAEAQSANVVETTGSSGFKKILCLIVQSSTWCGYLLVASQVDINGDDCKLLIQSWLQGQLLNLTEISPYDYFDIQIQATSYDEAKTWVEEKADYLEYLNIDKNEIFFSFFTLDPKFLIVELNENHEMIEVSLDLIDVDKQIPLSLFIHLPENKKYLLYTLPFQSLQQNQKQRLHDKSVTSLFTPIEFESEYKKIKAEKFLNNSFQNTRKDTGS